MNCANGLRKSTKKPETATTSATTCYNAPSYYYHFPSPQPEPRFEQEKFSSPPSTDGYCGYRNGKSCEGTKFGSCCGADGMCGDSATECGNGCQSRFGSCYKVSLDGTCGNGVTCKESGYGDCCAEGYMCGDDMEHCGNGCRRDFGDCWEPACPSYLFIVFQQGEIFNFPDTTTHSQIKRSLFKYNLDKLADIPHPIHIPHTPHFINAVDFHIKYTLDEHKHTPFPISFFDFTTFNIVRLCKHETFGTYVPIAQHHNKQTHVHFLVRPSSTPPQQML
ncbi:keratin-associated 5-4 protein [Rutstroemia sp. NJR-2017a BBW]|nr:keratin-associated 5-4 protein [Rutstroemia sp. NJR-2017a BBW]